MMRRVGWCTIIALAGCVQDPRDEEAMMQPTGVSASESESATESDSGMTMDTTGPGVLDIGDGMGTADPDDKSGCDKVDFLFVIDNSGSMGDNQANLIANFPGFMETIQNTLDDAQDYHVMVIDVDAWVWAGCETICDFPTPPPPDECLDAQGNCDASISLECFFGCGDFLDDLVCDAGYECGITQPMECEDVIGAGVSHPRGNEASNMDCGFSSGARYIDSTEPDLAAAFECAAKVGVGSTNDPERPMEAMVQAVTPGTPAATCNDGFLRDDAILVVTFITDEDDDAGDGSDGTVDGWRSALVSAKNGNEGGVVVLGLYGAGGGGCAEPSSRLDQFVQSWGNRGFSGSVCDSSYQQFFADAVGIIDTTCDEWTPEG
jgi:hypothetical protein